MELRIKFKGTLHIVLHIVVVDLLCFYAEKGNPLSCNCVQCHVKYIQFIGEGPTYIPPKDILTPHGAMSGLCTMTSPCAPRLCMPPMIPLRHDVFYTVMYSPMTYTYGQHFFVTSISVILLLLSKTNHCHIQDTPPRPVADPN